MFLSFFFFFCSTIALLHLLSTQSSQAGDDNVFSQESQWSATACLEDRNISYLAHSQYHRPNDIIYCG